jgi:hypothetical protein
VLVFRVLEGRAERGNDPGRRLLQLLLDVACRLEILFYKDTEKFYL